MLERSLSKRFQRRFGQLVKDNRKVPSRGTLASSRPITMKTVQESIQVFILTNGEDVIAKFVSSIAIDNTWLEIFLQKKREFQQSAL